MNLSLIVSVVGSDRPGLVRELSSVVTDAGGNWEGSRLVKLSGQFAGMVQVVLPKANLPDLESKLSSLKEKGLQVTVLHSDDIPAPESETGKVISLEVVGQDRSGIVAAISEAIAKLGANVLELATDCKAAAWSGETHFFTHATVSLPTSLSEEDLQQQIESIADDLMVEFPD